MQIASLKLNNSYAFLILTISFILVAAVLSSIVIIKNLNQQAEEETHSELATISDMKAKAITDWIKERKSDAEVAMYNSNLAEYISPSPGLLPVTKDTIIPWMSNFQTRYQYRSLFLLSNTGEKLISVPESGVLNPFNTNTTLNTALNSSDPVFTDLFIEPDTKEKLLEFWIPIRKKPAEPAVGVLVLQIDPQTYLYPLIQSWPTSSKSAESLIVRRIGDSVIFLNELRHVKNASFSLTIPITDTNVPAVMAAKGFYGIIEGADYRGVPVVASITNISETPWYLVTKIDKDEVYEPFRNFSSLVMGTIVLVITVGTLVILLIWRSRENDILQMEINQKNYELFLSDRIRLLMQGANDAILILDKDWHILEANERAVEWYGYTQDELKKMALFDLRTDEAKKQTAEDISRVEENGGILYITENRKKDGTVFPVEDSVRMITIQGTLYRQAIIHDISERKAHEAELKEKNTVLSSMNDELSMSYEELASQQEELRDQMETIRQSEEELYEAHRRLTEAQKAGHVGVWEYDFRDKTFWGTSECYNIYGFDNPADGIKDISEIISCLRDPDNVISAINEVIEKNSPFDVEFIVHPADDSPDRIVLSVGELYRDESGKPIKIAGVVRDVTEKRHLESDIRNYQEKLSALFNSPVIGILMGDIYGSVFQINDEFLRIIGYSRDDLDNSGIRWDEITPSEFLPLDMIRVSEAKENGSCTPYEKQYFRKDGTRIWVLVGFVLLEPERTESVAFILDISHKKENEEKIRLINQTLEERVTERTDQLSLINEELQTEVVERMAAEKNLQNTLSVLSATLESTPEGILVVDEKGIVSVYNKRFVQMWNVPDAVIRTREKTTVFELMAKQISNSESFLKYTITLSSESIQETADILLLTDERVIEMYSKPQQIGYAIVGRVYSFQDITQKKEMEQKIERSLREKEILLKEIHHRVKNNMQVVSSLLFMQSRLSSDPHLKEILLESQNRVKSIALVHEELYQSRDLDRIDYNRYLQKISRNIFDTYKIESSRISLRLSNKSEYLTISKAVPCSLIINELISNSLKHAFPNNRKGSIRIEFTLHDKSYHLIYADDGIGIPEFSQSNEPKTLGLELVRGLVRQLSGSLLIDRSQGTRYEITFPE